MPADDGRALRFAPRYRVLTALLTRVLVALEFLRALRERFIRLRAENEKLRVEMETAETRGYELAARAYRSGYEAGLMAQIRFWRVSKRN